MKVDELLTALAGNAGSHLHVMLPGGEFVPAHFHLTEVGRVQKDFIDCGGATRSTAACVLQVWVADDTDHRLDAGKMEKIIRMAAPILRSTDLPVEVEYDAGLLSQYPLAAVEQTPAGLLFHLGTKHTACLAMDKCGTARPDACCGTTGCS